MSSDLHTKQRESESLCSNAQEVAREWAVVTVHPTHQVFLLRYLLFVLLATAYGFSITIPVASPRRLDSSALMMRAGSDSVDDNGNRDSFMKSVRSIQDAFYSSFDSSDDRNGRPFLEINTGVMHNLPILISSLTELPGRQTVRFIDNPLDINMLESSLRRCQEQSSIDGNSSYSYIGQLYRDPNKTEIDNPLSRPKIESWKDIPPFDNAGDGEKDTCIGTLLRIVDFRRVTDGRMVLLVQGVERFAISKVHQKLPYISVDAQILPDEEELTDYPSIPSAVAAAFAWHSFEYENNVALIDDGSLGEEMPIDKISGERLSQLIPFAPFNSDMTEENLASLQETIAQASSSNTGTESYGHHLQSMQEFVATFTNFGEKGDVLTSTTESIEYDLWLCIDEYVRLRSLQELISPNLITLLPKYTDLPDDFCLNEIASNLFDADEAKKAEQKVETKRPNVQVGQSLHYPNERRLRRLSYSASALLGGSTLTDLLNKGVRQTLLEVPSTRGRLWAVLQRFVEYNSQLRSKHKE